jgi:hypothetical protein
MKALCITKCGCKCEIRITIPIPDTIYLRLHTSCTKAKFTEDKCIPGSPTRIFKLEFKDVWSDKNMPEYFELDNAT